MLRRLLPFFLLLIFTSCIDPVDTDLSTQRKHLVVEGYFTNEASLNFVRLSYSQPHSSPYNEFEEKAIVTVTSNEGEWYQFFYDKAGYYYPSTFGKATGVPGRTYTLNVTVGDQLYQSESVVMREPIAIDSVQFEVAEQTFAFPGEREQQLLPGYNVLVDYEDPAEEKTFLRWSFATQYEVRTQPQDYIHPFTGLPAPKECCTQCFLEENLEQLKVIDDRLTNGKKVLRQNVLFMPFEKYLGVKNKLTLYQHSISEDAYNFFRILEQQKLATGTVFDPPPAEVKGNITSVNNENEQVIGFFDVSGVSIRQVTILRNDIDYPFAPFRYPDDCEVMKGATRVIPEGW
ncbi:DUF4249 domain-containing protein [Pontibacter sp. HSC-36F09]|uniref:DUF4249 domain-containing protein n=1 Tax=Pontibacter sp. HSC-36F09 TaxID=2910966 RepID=UPI00209F088E|nr:DUF4249 domain-containing protein [Pontibacter sp. HSC-36F09]MCP2045684.1 hypothetical protein [Pontibacter sp. HSC-36F09]